MALNTSAYDCMASTVKQDNAHLSATTVGSHSDQDGGVLWQRNIELPFLREEEIARV